MKNKLLQNTLILLITSTMIRLLSLLNRILLTRYLGEEGISLYSLILPTIMLFMSLSCFSLNTAMIKVSAIHKNKKVINHCIIIAIITTSISSIILLLILKYLSMNLLKQEVTYYPILISIPALFLTSISSVLRGYLTGIEKVSDTSFANLIEQITRILFTILVFILIPNKSITYYLILVIIAMSIGELFSIIFTSIRIKNLKIDNIILNNKISKELLDIAIPTTLTSLVSNITFFLEPIIFTFVLTKLNFSSSDILLKYSEVTAYALPLITLFSFISISISTVIMPKISVSNKETIKNYIEKLIIICLIPGLLLSTIFFNYSKEISFLLYNTYTGSILVKKYVWFFIVFYLISPFNAILQSTNQSKKAFIISLITHILKLILLFILPIFLSDSLIICYLLSYILTFLFQIIILHKQYKFKFPFKKIIYLLLITLNINFICLILNFLNLNYIISIIILSFIFVILNFFFIKRNNI